MLGKQVYNRSDDVSNTPYRTDVVRSSNRFNDLAKEIVLTYKTYCDIESYVAPLVARNADNPVFLLTKDLIHDKVKNSWGMNSFMYSRLLDAVEKFYLKNRNQRRLPSPHIISHRSVHYGEGLFEVTQVDTEKYLKENPRIRNFKVNTVHKIEVAGLKPMYIENMRRGNYKYMVLRPKLGRSGAPSLDHWEILLYSTNFGYNVEHIDTDKNPRYNGTI